jgi:hypothetical protein
MEQSEHKLLCEFNPALIFENTLEIKSTVLLPLTPNSINLTLATKISAG